VSIAKGDLFALPEHIEPYLGGVLAQLAGEQHLRGLDRDPFIDRLTHYLAEINATHPFREGNGRTQRAFLQQLAQDASYRIDWRTLDPQENIDASRAAHRGDNQPLRAILAQLVTTPEQDEITRVLSAASPRPPRPTTTPTRSSSQQPRPPTRRSSRAPKR
jgi:cell filamentation protein